MTVVKSVRRVVQKMADLPQPTTQNRCQISARGRFTAGPKVYIMASVEGEIVRKMKIMNQKLENFNKTIKWSAINKTLHVSRIVFQERLQRLVHIPHKQ